MHQLDIHAISVVAEDLNLILIHDVASVATDEVLSKLTLDSLGGTAQHIVAQLAIGLVVYLDIVVLRLYIVEAIDIDAHLESTGTVYEVDEFGVSVIGLIIHDVHTYAVEQCTLVTIDSLLHTDDIGHYNDK